MAALTKETKITLGAAISAVSIAISATWWVSNQLSDIKRQLATLTKDSYTISAACEQSLRMAIENPGLRVPDPRDPTKVFIANARNPYPPIEGRN